MSKYCPSKDQDLPFKTFRLSTLVGKMRCPVRLAALSPWILRIKLRLHSSWLRAISPGASCIPVPSFSERSNFKNLFSNSPFILESAIESSFLSLSLEVNARTCTDTKELLELQKD